MCGADDLAYLAAAMAVAGAATTAYGADRAQTKMDSRASAELQRQAELRKQAANQFSASLAKTTPEGATDAMNRGAEQKKGLYEQLGAQTATGYSQPGLALNPGSPASIRSGAQIGQSNATRSQLGGIDQWTLEQMIKNIRAQQELGMLGQQAGHSAALLPMELQQASRAGDTYAGLGGLIGTAGSLLGAYGASGALNKPAGT